MIINFLLLAEGNFKPESQNENIRFQKPYESQNPHKIIKSE